MAITKAQQEQQLAQLRSQLASAEQSLKTKEDQIYLVDSQIRSKNDAIAYWDKVLAKDPNNADAKASRQTLIDDKAGLVSTQEGYKAQFSNLSQTVSDLNSEIYNVEHAEVIVEQTATSTTTTAQIGTNTTETVQKNAATETGTVTATTGVSTINPDGSTQTSTTTNITETTVQTSGGQKTVTVNDPPTAPSTSTTNPDGSNVTTTTPGTTTVTKPASAGGGSTTTTEIPPKQNTGTATPAQVQQAVEQPDVQDLENSAAKGDWRVRLGLASQANYLYMAEDPGILAPLKATHGVIFPYTPTITVNYNANYNNTEIVHSNYRYPQYINSNVDSLNITCDFTAQDNYEATYMLAVIHFFRSVTKMFYGQDENPKPGTPPPLCFLYGLGTFQFNKHPLVINNFSYNLPNDVDYIRAKTESSAKRADNGVTTPKSTTGGNFLTTALGRLGQGAIKGMGSTAQGILGKLAPGGSATGPSSVGLNAGFNGLSLDIKGNQTTYVPTRIQISISALPITTRYDASNNFSFKSYARGWGVSKGGFW